MIPFLLLLKYLAYMNLENNDISANKLTDHCFVMKSNAQLPFCNRVCATPDLSDDEIQRVLAYFGSTPFRWLVHNTETIIHEKLEHHNLKKVCTFPAMIADITPISQKDYGTDIQVREIDTKTELSEWVSLVARSYAQGQVIMDTTEFLTFVHYLLINAPDNIKLYFAYYKNTPVATSMIIKHGTVIGVHWIGTLPEYRGKGIGFAVSHKPLVDAQQLGCTHAILLASDMGKPVYEKIGFTEYARYDVYGKA